MRVREFESDKNEVDDVRAVKVKMRFKGNPLTLFAIYGLQRADKRRKLFWETINEIVTAEENPCIIVGDLNAITDVEETINVASAAGLLEPVLSSGRRSFA